MRAAARLSSALAAAGAGGASLASAIAFGSPAGTEARSTPTSMGGGAVTFSPAAPPSDRPGMRLALVQVLSRHGDRTSINPLPSETREQWESLLPTDEASSTLDARATPTPPNPRLLDARKPESWHGQLTTQGVAQLVHTGAALRAWLVDERALLPASLTDARSAGAVKIRSTSTRRTVQSAQSLILGLYPAETDADAVASSSRATSPEPLPIEVRDRMRESMFPNPGMACERQIELMRSLDGDPSVKAAEAAAWERASLTAVRQEVHRRNLDARRAERELAAAGANAAGVSSPDSVGGEATVADVSERPASGPATDPNASPNDVSSASKRARDPRLPSATSVWEPLQARANHGLPLPGGVVDDDLAAIRRARGGALHQPRDERRGRRARRGSSAPRVGGRGARGGARRIVDAALRLLGPRFEHHRAARGVGRVWGRVAARRVHGGRGDVDALAGRERGGAAALERAIGDGEGGGRGYGSGGVQRRGASARGVRGTGPDPRRGVMLAGRLQGHGARERPERLSRRVRPGGETVAEGETSRGPVVRWSL